MREYEIIRLRKYFDEEVSKELRIISEYFLNLNKPKVFNPYADDCILTENDKTFEEICNAMEESGFMSVRNVTVFEFYSKIAYLEKRAAKMRQQYQK